MEGQTSFRLRNPMLMLVLAAAFPMVAHAGAAATVDFAVGEVSAITASGTQRSLTKGAELNNGDTVKTGDGARAQIRFADGAMMSLQPLTELRIDDFQYVGKADGDERGFFSLLKGGLRTITGWVGRSHRDNYRVKTAVATIGIRGTEYTAALDATNEELLVHTGEGLVEVCNDNGCVLLAAGESGVVGGRNGQPQRTTNRPPLPPTPIELASVPIFATGGDLLVPTSPMPTSGSATYATILAASPVMEASGYGLPAGVLTSASLTANFGSLTVASNLAGTIGGYNFSVNATGSISGNSLSASLPYMGGGGGSFCGGMPYGCYGSVSGSFYGASASQVGVSYLVNSTIISKQITGSALLGK